MTLITPRNVGIAAAAAIGVVGAGALARTMLHRHDDDGDAQAVPTAPSAAKQGVDHLPHYSWKGRDMAVAWWPEDMRIDHAGGTDQLHFGSIIGNLGNQSIAIAPGDHVDYTVYRRQDDGSLGEQVGSGHAALDRLDIQPFPPPFGESTGRPSSSFGVDLRHVDHLDPQTIGVIGPDQAEQAVDVTGAGPGSYVLRQTIVRADTQDDPNSHNDVRDTGYVVGADGDAFQVSSAYAG